MMNFKCALMTLATVLMAAAPALADDVKDTKDSKGGLFVEPAITYEKSESSVNWPSPLSDSTGTADGLGIGARFGFHLNEAFFIGADARYSMPRFKSSANYEADSTATNYGAVVGFQMPNVGLRIWGTYVLGGELDPKADGNFDVKFEKATGYRVGAGFRVQSVSLNLEYQDLKYGNSVLQKFGPLSGAATFDDVNLKNKSWIASVSFPLEF